MKKILITGVDGGLGAVITKLLSDDYEIIETNRKSMDVSDEIAVNKVVSKVKPDIIIHCAAIVNADQAQADKSKTYQVNVKGTENIAKACEFSDAELVFFSSDYVFNGEGDSPYDEDSLIDPINYYGVTKVIGEQIVRDIVSKHYILRVSWLFGPAGNNFLQKILNKKNEDEIFVVDDQIGSPTYTVHLSNVVKELLYKNQYGTYNVSNEGFCSWAEYAREILFLSDSKTKVIPVNSDSYKTLAKRPMNSRLSKEKLYSIGIEKLPTWKEALKEYFNNNALYS